MTSNLKAFGLALLATFALGALFAGGAQAEEGTIKVDVNAEGPATLTGEQIEHAGSPHHVFEVFAGKITCEETTFDGTVEDGDHDITVTPTYDTCTTKPSTGGSFTTTVTPEKCYYTFTGGNATPENADHFEGITSSLLCPNAGESIKIHVYKSSVHNEGHTEENQRCTYEVKPFEHKLHTTATNTTTPEIHDVDVTSEVTGIAVKRTFGTFLQCGAENQSSTYTGGTTLRAYKDEAHTEQVSLTLTDVG